MIPPRLAPYLVGLMVSGLMTFIVSGISTFRALGMPEAFVAIWMENWAVSWAVAFPVISVVMPIARHTVARWTRAVPENA